MNVMTDRFRDATPENVEREGIASALAAGSHIGNGPLHFPGNSRDMRRRGREAAAEGGVDMLRLFARIMHYRWLLAAFIAVGLIGGLATAMLTAPRYRATAKLEVLVPSARIFQDMEFTSEAGDVRSYLTVREKLRSRSLAERVVRDLGLAEREDFLPKSAGLPLDERIRMAVEKVLANLAVEPIANTVLLSVTYSDSRPAYAAEIANRIARGFIERRTEQAGDSYAEARNFIQAQASQVKDRLQQSEKRLADYARSVGITVAGGEDALIAAKLADTAKALALAMRESLDYGRPVQQIDDGRGASLTPVMGSTTLEKLRGRLAELKAEYRRKLMRFKPASAEMRQLDAQVREIEAQLSDGVETVLEAMRIRHGEMLARVDNLKRGLADMEAEQAAYQDKRIQYSILKREVDSDRAQYESLIARLSEIDVGS